MEIVIFVILVILVVLNINLTIRLSSLRQYISSFKQRTEGSLNRIVEELAKNRDILVKYRDNAYKNNDYILHDINVIKKNQVKIIDSLVNGSATVELSDADIDKLAAKLKPVKTSKSKLNKAVSEDKK